MRASRFVPALGLLLVVLLWPGSALPQARPEVDAERWRRMSERFDGVWVVTVSPARARRTVEAAVDRAVDAMSFFLRGVARPLIRDNTPVNLEIELRFRPGRRIFVRFDDRARYTTPLGQTRQVRTHEGDPMRMTQRFRGETLEQVFQAERGTRWNVFTSVGEDRMRMDATTVGDMMPEPLRFSLTYRRRR